ncbi:uncharacterized protein LOC112512558 [Cynara cardunculus var. scolymus]|uniref:uncharacterized protein LOC112512558 n=1 Tax=Cynara cardunculus var. scolymus TaxID=59895 RepID=UPI000D63029C|nr:uncharacterized protein LOC112512558 [Cynara cardunculus var. scolymus]XP_024974353.1 uncharacterized protein LOC112512558 [Cynara cardunculus var. scolymus]
MVAIQPYIKFPVYGNCVTELCFVPKGLWSQYQRKCYARYGRVTRNFSIPGGLQSTNLKSRKCHDRRMECHCSGNLINTDTNASGWIPVIDQVLLMGSVFLTHLAGGLPVDRSFTNFGRKIFIDDIAPEEPIFSGSAATNDKDSEVNLNLSWDTVKGKLIDSISAIERGAKLDDGNMETEQIAKQPSCLAAVAEGPRFRLLWASFQWLKNEVDNISINTYTPDVKIWQKGFSEILQRSSLSVCIDWLKEELSLKHRGSIKDLPSPLLEKLDGYDSVLQYIKKSGKEELYTELVYILRFGALSQECCYDYNFFTLHGVTVLEDMVITLAEGIASMYLELISVDSDISNEMNNLGLSLCTLSTRALQRLRNEVALNQWLYQNMEAVVSMYEDRLDLRMLQTRTIVEPSNGKAEKFGWLKNLNLRKSRPVTAPFRAFVISYVSIPVKRTKELRALTGWRYYCSLFLESADIIMPFIRTLFAKISDAVSFFLVCLIGRSLGLIYTGIRQSLRWK